MGAGSASVRAVKGHWEDRDNRVRFVDSLAKELGIKKAQDWRGVEKKAIKGRGGAGLLRLYEGHRLGTVFGLLCDTLPGVKEEDILEYRARLPRGYWGSVENRKRFLTEVLAPRLKVGEASDWSSVSSTDVQGAGGATLLQYYGSSMRQMLAELVGEEAAVKERSLPNMHWKSQENRRALVRVLEREHGIREPSDWRRVRNKEVMAQPGGSSLLNRYNGSFWAMLRDTLPEAEAWDEEQCRVMVPRGYWDSMERRRAFFERLAKEKGVRSQDDWARVTTADIVDAGGGGLMGRYGSVQAALEDLYGTEREGEEWDARRCRPTVPGSYWDEESNVAAFIHEIKDKLSVKEKEDWYRVSKRQLHAVKAAGLLQKMTLATALGIAYPNEDWYEEGMNKRDKRSTQRTLFSSISSIFVESAASHTRQ